MTDIEIEINGKKLLGKPNQTIIQVADAADIYIPRFCYHKHLSIAANCRMCLVEVAKSSKTLPACATPIASGMQVFTQSKKTMEAQRAVMEFLLINHPLDCPICDQGGECELQDLSMGYGASSSPYRESKRALYDQNLGPLIATEMTRCIYCTRCVRFGDEIAGMRELGGTYRGEHTEIGTYVEEAVRSEVSGNIIDLCPVGALTSKPFRFTARAFELDQADSISPHDCLGTALYVHMRYGKVMRVVARENRDINETWLADRDRYSYTALYHQDRLEEPIARIDGRWQVIPWEDALKLAASRLYDMIAEFGVDKIGALASPLSTVEEFYLLQKIMRELGTSHIDHRLRECDTRDQAHFGAYPGLNMPIAQVDECELICLIGSNIRKEQPLLALRLRQAALKGAKIIAINPMDYVFHFSLEAKKIIAPHQLQACLASLLDSSFNQHDQAMQRIAELLKSKKKCAIFLGASVMHHPQAASIRYIAQQLAALSGATLHFLTDGANTAGAWLAGAIPHRLAGGVPINQPGLSAYEMLTKPRKAYVLMNVEPDFDFAHAQHAIQAMKQAKWIVALSMYRNPILEAHAHVILPMAPFTETSGTFVNGEGRWQHFKGTATPFGSSRPGWKILRALGNFLHLKGFDYESSDEVTQEVKGLVDNMQHIPMQFSPLDILHTKHNLSRIGNIPLYRTDSLVRRAIPLQEAQTIMEGDMALVRLHPNTAKKFMLQEGDMVQVKQASFTTILPLMFDTCIAEDAAWIAGGIAETMNLGDLYGEVEIGKVQR